MQISTALNLPNPKINSGLTGPALYGPSLDLRLSDSSELDPRVSFSRASNATRVGPTGLIEYAPHNLLTYSEQFDNAAWTGSGGVTANNILSPNGTQTGDTISTLSAGLDKTSASASVISGATLTLSVYIKTGGTVPFVRLQLWDNSANGCRVWVNNATGAVGTPVTLGTGTVVSANSVAVNNGWYRVSITGTIGTGSSAYFSFAGADADGSFSRTATQTYGIWGAQLNVGALQPYYPTTVKNLLGYTQEFDNAAWTKSNSFVQTNLLTYSQEFDNAVWAKASGITVTANEAAAPNQTLSADKFAIGSSTFPQISQYTTVSVSLPYTFSIYVKNIGVNFVQLRVRNASAITNYFRAIFNLTTGEITQAVGFGNGSIVDSSATDVGNGWWKLSISGIADTSGTQLTVLAILGSDSSGNVATPSTNNATDGVYLWGAQLVQGSTAGDYTRTFGSAVAVGYVAPDGSVTAEKLVENTATSTHTVSPATSTVVTNTDYVFSCYAKAGERNGIRLTEYNDATDNEFCSFDLVEGTATSFGGTTPSITSVGNGWYRCSVKFSNSVDTTTSLILTILNDGSATYTGDGTSGIYIWGAQLSDSASVDPYVYNPVAAPSASAYYGPRFDYDPVTLAPKGLLIEEQRTNLLTYSEQFDNAAWIAFRASITANTVIAPDGTLTGDKLVEDTTASSTHGTNRFQALTDNLDYSFSCFIKAAERSIVRMQVTNKANTVCIAYFNTSTGVVSDASNATGTMTLVGNGWYKCVLVFNASTGGTTPIVLISPTTVAGTSYYTGDGTSGIYLWGAQLEAGSFPTSYIPTTSASVTRSADVATMVGANFSNWYNATTGAIFVDYATMQRTGFPSIVSASDGGNTNRIQMSHVSADRRAVVTAGGVSQWDTQGGVLGSTSSGVFAKFDLAYEAANYVAVVNGGTPATQSSGAVPSGLNRLVVGADGASGNFLNGHISRIAYFPRRLANTELQAITA